VEAMFDEAVVHVGRREQTKRTMANAGTVGAGDSGETNWYPSRGRLRLVHKKHRADSSSQVRPRGCYEVAVRITLRGWFP